MSNTWPKPIKDRTMRRWRLIWAPSWTTIATVDATTAQAARRKAPPPYRKYLGEVHVMEVLA